MALLLPEPEKILIKHAGAATFDFTCGPQKPMPIAIEYAAHPDPRTGTEGLVRSLEF